MPDKGRKEGGHALFFFFYYYFFFLPIPEEPSSTSRYDLESGLCMDVCERNVLAIGCGGTETAAETNEEAETEGHDRPCCCCNWAARYW